MPRIRASLLPALILISLAGLTACSGKAELKIGGDPAVPEKEVERNSREQLSAKVGEQAPPIDCPDDLKAKVGTVMTCTMQLEGKPYDVTVTVTELKGGKALFDVKVANEPRGG